MPSPTRLFVLAGLLAAGMACSSEPATPAAPPPTASGKAVDASTAGRISGTVIFDGPAPTADRLRMTSDPSCVSAAGPSPVSDAVLVGKNGALHNAFVYIKGGLDPAYTFAPATATIELDQKGCRYVPRVIGVRVGQTVDLVNSDQTLHNVHALPNANREFNLGLTPGTRMSRTFSVPEVMVRFKCDVHNWMGAWVGVVAHPFFAVTGEDGTFTLQGVPPGTYDVEVWHETFGSKQASVTVAASGAATASFTFTPASGH